MSRLAIEATPLDRSARETLEVGSKRTPVHPLGRVELQVQKNPAHSGCSTPRSPDPQG